MKYFDNPRLNAMIAKHGWLITGVPGGALYTVGLIDKFKHPELVVHGLPFELSGGTIHRAVYLIERGTRFQAGPPVGDVAEGGYLVKPVEVDRSNYRDWFGLALDYHDRELSMLQLVWPDRRRHFPGDPGAIDTGQKVFDVRHADYDSVKEQWPEGYVCSGCGRPGGRCSHGRNSK